MCFLAPIAPVEFIEEAHDSERLRITDTKMELADRDVVVLVNIPQMLCIFSRKLEIVKTRVSSGSQRITGAIRVSPEPKSQAR